ncbi:polysaccharide lyase [Chroococcidiopsis sp. CCMEE 29]|uniref:polysaccharide lyase n=1 Tax=Chroococcidiopsis sp. CCMEE 29 TaxID=155894 RepID=UPI0020213520|nr:polysaccharide lyase [Chroococcidiopsis sp. CCMEE 29]
MSTKDFRNSTTPQRKRLSWQNKRLLKFALGVVLPIILLSTIVGARIPTDTANTDIASTKSPKIIAKRFERDLSGWGQELCCKHSAQIASHPTRAGGEAVKITLKKSDPYFKNSRPRAELKLRPVPANSEHWYGLSLFIPKEYTLEPKSFEIITQFISPPDKDLGEKWHRPSLTLSMRKKGFTLTNYWDSRQITKGKQFEGRQQWNLGAVEKGKWIDFVYHAKWSYKSDGLLEAWKGGKLILRRKGANTFNDKRGPSFKMGIYKPDWKSRPERSITTQRIIYFDEVRIGDASASYKDVAP